MGIPLTQVTTTGCAHGQPKTTIRCVYLSEADTHLLTLWVLSRCFCSFFRWNCCSRKRGCPSPRSRTACQEVSRYETRHRSKSRPSPRICGHPELDRLDEKYSFGIDSCRIFIRAGAT